MEVLYTLDYKVKKIIPNNGYHACFSDNETTGNGIFDIYQEEGTFVSSKEFLKGNYTANPSVNLIKAIVKNPNNSIATGTIDNETGGYWSALRQYDTNNNPFHEKIAYNTGCIPYLVDGVFYGVFYVLEDNDMMDTGWSFPYTGGIQELFIAPINNDLSLDIWVIPISDLHTNANSVKNIQAMPNGNLMISILGDFSPPITRTSLAIEVDSTTGNVIDILAEGYGGEYDFYRYDNTTGDLYSFSFSAQSIYRTDTSGNITHVNFPTHMGSLFSNHLTNIQFVDDEVVGINLFEFGQTTHLSKSLIQGYTTPSFNFNSNFSINSGWMNNDGSQTLPVAYTGDGMQIGTTSLPNITDWNTVVCKMTNTEPLALRGTLSDVDENIIAVKNHQIYNGTDWVDGYYQSTLIFSEINLPNDGDIPNETWVEAAIGMEILYTTWVDEIIRDGEILKVFVVSFKKTGATGVDLVEVAMEVILKSTNEVGMATGDFIMGKENTIVYPNPTIDLIKLKTTDQKATITIYNTIGQHVAKYNWSQDNNTIDISHLKKGTYFVTIKTNKGLTYQKIIKK